MRWFLKVSWVFLAFGLIVLWANDLALQADPPILGDIPTRTLQNEIRSALDGDAPAKVADPILQDTLETIRRRGSLLQGSVVDELSRNASTADVADPQKTRRSTIYRAAESLLKTARNLESIDQSGKMAEDIAALRNLARRLLDPN